MRQLTEVAQRAFYIQAPPIRSEDYKRWIRSWPCLVCATRRQVEAAHTGPHGIGQKASDLQTVPLCKEHHAELHQGVQEFQERHQIELADVVAMFNALWSARRKKAA
jgi:Protein of unknown function (DUF968)